MLTHFVRVSRAPKKVSKQSSCFQDSFKIPIFFIASIIHLKKILSIKSLY